MDSDEEDEDDNVSEMEVDRYSSKICNYCRDSTKKLHRCLRCFSAWYCGNDCQCHDWKHHKRSCRKFESEYRPVRLIYESPKLGDLTPNNTIDPNKRFQTIVKVQKSFSDQDLLVENENSTVLGLIESEDPLHSPLLKTIERKGILKLKGYFYAIKDPKGLSIKIGEIITPKNKF